MILSSVSCKSVSRLRMIIYLELISVYLDTLTHNRFTDPFQIVHVKIKKLETDCKYSLCKSFVVIYPGSCDFVIHSLRFVVHAFRLCRNASCIENITQRRFFIIHTSYVDRNRIKAAKIHILMRSESSN